MTAFVESFATQQLLPPWRAIGARTWCFAFRLDVKLVQAYLDKYFNGQYPDQAPFAYTPLPGPQFGLLSVCYFPHVRSTLRGDDPVSGGDIWDRISHTEVYLAFPVLRHVVDKDGLMGAPTLVWVQPVVWSDNDMIVFSSREIWGTDMFLATIDRDTSLPSDHLHLDLGMVGIKHFNPRSVDELLACLHVQATDPTDRDLTSILQANPDLQGFVDILGGSGMFADHAPPPGVKQSPYPGGVELDNLKQFRDCYDMSTAIYRAIVASKTDYAHVADIVFYDADKVGIAFMWSDTLKELLTTILGADKPTDEGPPPEHGAGAPSDLGTGMDWAMDRVTLRPELAFAFEATIDFRVLATLHTYGAAA
jgi:hypothetical protein